jgi:hypothetical protein
LPPHSFPRFVSLTDASTVFPAPLPSPRHFNIYPGLNHVFNEPDAASEFYAGRLRMIELMSPVVSFGVNARLQNRFRVIRSKPKGYQTLILFSSAIFLRHFFGTK